MFHGLIRERNTAIISRQTNGIDADRTGPVVGYWFVSILRQTIHQHPARAFALVCVAWGVGLQRPASNVIRDAIGQRDRWLAVGA